MKKIKWILFLIALFAVALPLWNWLGNGRALVRNPQQRDLALDRGETTEGNSRPSQTPESEQESSLTRAVHPFSINGPPLSADYYLPVEATLLSGESISAERAELLLTSSDFSKSLQRFRDEGAGDAQAQRISIIYQDEFEIRYKNSTSKLVEIRCGLTLCAGAVRDNANSTNYKDVLDAMISSSQPPIYSYTDYSLGITESQVEHRFVFSIDPRIASVSAP